MTTKKKADESAEPKIPQSVEDLRNRTPEDLEKMVTVLDAHLRTLHQDENGSIRTLSADEKAAFDLGMNIRNEAIKLIEDHRNIMAVFQRRPKAVDTVYKSILDEDNLDQRRLTNSEARDRALKVLDSREAKSMLKPDQMDRIEHQMRYDPLIARRILVTENDEYRTAWQKLVTNPNGLAFLSQEEREAVQAYEEFRAMSEGTTTAGGFGIPVFIDPSIILTAQGSGNPFLQIAKEVTINTNVWKGVSSAGVTWAFQAEAATVADNSPAIAQPQVTVFMARGFIPYSIEVGQDYPGFADEMATLLAAGYDELLVQKFAVGSGSGEPNGIVTALDADTTAEVRLTTAGSYGEIDLYNAWKALPQRFRRNASFMMSVGVNNATRRFGTANVYHATTINLPAGWADTLFLRPVYENPYFADNVNTTGAWNQLVVGDFSNYVIARRGGMTVELLPLIVDVTNNRPTGQRGWFAYARIGGGPSTNAAFKLLNQT